MKKIVTILLAIAMIACFVPMFAFNASADTREIKLDGDLSDWAGLHTVDVVGTGETEGKKATFYGYRASEGLYLAVDATHSILYVGEGAYWDKSFMEIFISANYNDADNTKKFAIWPVAEDGHEMFKDASPVDDAYFKTEKSGDFYHTIVEVFISNANLPEIATINGVTVGMAWATPGDNLIGGSGDAGGYYYYWAPKGAWTPNCQLTANSNGLFLSEDVETGATEGVNAGEWTVDGNNYSRTGGAPGTTPAVYILGNSKKVTMTFTTTAGGQFCALVAAADLNGDNVITEQIDSYYLVYFLDNGVVAIARNAGQWEGWAIEGTVAYTADADGKVAITVDYDNGKITVKNGDTVLVEWTDSDPLMGTGFGIGAKPDNRDFVVDNVTVPEPEPVEPDDPDTPDTPDEPTVKPTGTASIVIAAVAVVTLAGATIVASKRRASK